MFDKYKTQQSTKKVDEPVKRYFITKPVRDFTELPSLLHIIMETLQLMIDE